MSFAAGFFGSLSDQAKTYQQAKADEARLRMMKNLDVEFQRSRRIVDRDGKKWELTFDGNGKEIPGLARELAPEEARKIQAEDNKSQLDIKDTTYKLSNYDRLQQEAEAERKAKLEHEAQMRPLDIQGKKASIASSLQSTATNRIYGENAALDRKLKEEQASTNDPIFNAIDKVMTSREIQQAFVTKDDEGEESFDYAKMAGVQQQVYDELLRKGVEKPTAAQVKALMLQLLGGALGSSTPTSLGGYRPYKPGFGGN